MANFPLPSTLCLIGLGNPGDNYQNTRHNVGFWFVENFARYVSIHFKKLRFQPCLYASISTDQLQQQFSNIDKLLFENILLIKPLTFMNNSKQVLPSLIRKFQNLQFLIIADTLDLEVGKARLKRRGGSAGHKGLASINQVLNQNFWTLYIGIGRPLQKELVVQYVLEEPNKNDRNIINRGIEFWTKEIFALITEDLSTVIARINSTHVNDLL